MRPQMLRRNWESLVEQTSNDWMQTRLPDLVGIGVEAANAKIAEIAPMLTGDYIWILDDDDECFYRRFVQEVLNIAVLHNPELIMVRMDHGLLGIRPNDRAWRRSPTHGQYGCSSFVARRDLFQTHAHRWATGVYHADYMFLETAYRHASLRNAVYWHNIVASRVQRISYGMPE